MREKWPFFLKLGNRNMAISLKILNVGKIQGHQRIPRGKIRLVGYILGRHI